MTDRIETEAPPVVRLVAPRSHDPVGDLMVGEAPDVATMRGRTWAMMTDARYRPKTVCLEARLTREGCP